MMSSLWAPRSPRAPKWALFLSKNQVVLVRLTLQFSGPLWRKLLCTERMLPIIPDCKSSRAFRWVGSSRWLWPIIKIFPMRWAVSIMVLVSSRVRAMGFSHSTCLPASSALME